MKEVLPSSCCAINLIAEISVYVHPPKKNMRVTRGCCPWANSNKKNISRKSRIN